MNYNEMLREVAKSNELRNSTNMDSLVKLIAKIWGYTEDKVDLDLALVCSEYDLFYRDKRK